MANIQGIDTEYKPWGLTAGAMVGERQADTDAANILALQESQLANVLKQRDAMEASAQMQNPEWLKWKLAGQIGEGMSKGATGQFDQGVLKDKMDSQIEEFRAKKGEHELNKLSNTLDLVLSSYNANGPLGVKSLQGKIPDELYQYIATNPNSIAELTALSDRLKSNRADTPKAREAINLKNVEGENQYITSTDVADINAASHKYTADAHLQGVRIGKEMAADQRKDAQSIREEEALTRRMNAIINELKTNETDMKRIDEELSSIPMMPQPGKTTAEKIANKEKALREKRLEREATMNQLQYLRSELRRVGGLSKYSNKAEQGTKDNPIVLK